MQVGIIEMPAEGTWRVKLGEELIPGYFVRNKHGDERYAIHLRREGKMQKLRTEPHSREGASCLILFHYFEEERKMLNAQKGAAADADADN